MAESKNGNSIANFSVAVDSGWGDNKRTEWVRCVAFGKLADVCGNYLEKGKLVYVEGEMQTGEWEDKDGNKRNKTEIVLYSMKMLGGKGESPSSDDEWTESVCDNTEDDLPF